MITLKVEDYCQNCPMFEPDVERNVYFAGINKEHVDTFVRCSYSERCAAIKEHIEKENKS